MGKFIGYESIYIDGLLHSEINEILSDVVAKTLELRGNYEEHDEEDDEYDFYEESEREYQPPKPKERTFIETNENIAIVETLDIIKEKTISILEENGLNVVNESKTLNEAINYLHNKKNEKKYPKFILYRESDVGYYKLTEVQKIIENHKDITHILVVSDINEKLNEVYNSDKVIKVESPITKEKIEQIIKKNSK